MTKAQILQGRVLKYLSGFYDVYHGDIVTTCKIRGKLKRGAREADIIAIGDIVEFSILADGSGIIERVCPRKNELIRMDSGVKYEYRQILISNLDQILLVFSCAFPEPRLRMLDRFLVICEKQRIHPVIVVNKIDLKSKEEIDELFDIYSAIGYEILYTSAENEVGIDELREILSNKISGLVGPSGAGKSSLVNRIDPDLNLKVNEISEYNEKGRHTTVVREMFKLKDGGFVADLPGIKTLALWDTEPEELDGYFPELRDLVSQCYFSDCTHDESEVNCAVKEALLDGRVSKPRYESYLRMRFGKEDED